MLNNAQVALLAAVLHSSRSIATSGVVLRAASTFKDWLDKGGPSTTGRR